MPDLSDRILLSMGGSGARCAEALIYLCAAGLAPESLTMVFIDADTNNHSLQRAVELALLYGKLQPGTPVEHEATPFLRTRITLPQNPVWSPFSTGAAQPSLAEHFQYSTLKANVRNPVALTSARLMEALYTEQQRRAPLDVGFRGKPSIGAAIFADSLQVGVAPWNQVIQSIRNGAANGPVRIFACGSLFGGTGAAGLPNIPPLLRDSVQQGRENVYLGAVLLLPYFTFSAPPQLAGEYASPELFLLNSCEALRHYHARPELFSQVYVLGTENQPAQPKFALGGREQANLPHFVELLGGLAAASFFGTQPAAGSRTFLLSASRPDEFTWQDVPDTSRVHPALNDLARFSLFYLAAIFPRLQRIRANDPMALRTPWYRDLFVRRNVFLNDPETWSFLCDLRLFAARYLCWLRDLQRNVRDYRLHLVSGHVLDAISEDSMDFPMQKFDSDLLQQQGYAQTDAGTLWRNLCHLCAGRHISRSLHPKRAVQKAFYDAVLMRRS
jgi:hypothetical protein